MPPERFRFIARFDPAPLLAELAVNAELFALDQRHKVRAHEHTQSITLRGGSGRNVHDAHDLNAKHFPRIMEFLTDLALAQRESRLARALIVRLAPGQQVAPHIDEGAYYAKSDRYHAVLQSAGSVMTVDGVDSEPWMPGEVWWFDNKRTHSARHAGGDWRVHIIFDLWPRKE